MFRSVLGPNLHRRLSTAVNATGLSEMPKSVFQLSSSDLVRVGLGFAGIYLSGFGLLYWEIRSVDAKSDAKISELRAHVDAQIGEMRIQIDQLRDRIDSQFKEVNQTLMQFALNRGQLQAGGAPPSNGASKSSY